MNIYYSIEDFPADVNTIVTIGTFDGVHAGHRTIINRINTIAKNEGLESLLLTFYPHPRHIIYPDDQQLRLINTIDENIDVLNYTENTKLYITRALSPAKISSIKINEETKSVDVNLKPEQVSLAIGKGGYNIRLAGQLTGYEIDVYRDIDVGEEEDVPLSEFLDEIDEWIIDVFKKIGCDTAKSVLELDVKELAKRTDLEETTIVEVQNILKSEFENN